MKRILTLNRHLTERIGFTAITLLAMITVLPIVGTVIYILAQGAPAISLEFITGFPRDGMREGGILPAIIGTFGLMGMEDLVRNQTRALLKAQS